MINYKNALSSLVILYLCVTHSQALSAQSHNIRVNTSLGEVIGLGNGQTESFKGIPYAKPPMGDYRWRPPRPLSTWPDGGTLTASEFGADCAQAAFPPQAGKVKAGSSEDCLFLNIWRPADSKPGAKLPVMVWIHGGAFVFGSGSGAETSGEQFAQNGVILITLNYRLGRLGHFAFPALSAEHPEEFKGSYAYMDQILALNWVQEHIQSFGGDPDKVTIFGESAGGVSVHSLLSIPSADGLFHRAIIQSGGGRDGVLTGRPLKTNNTDRHYPVAAETIGGNFAQRHGIQSTDKGALQKLRDLPVEDIVDGGLEFDQQQNAAIYAGPILDGKLVTQTAETAYKAGRQSKVPLLIGSNTAEVPAGFVNAQTKPALWQQFGTFKAQAMAAYDPKGDKPLEELLTYINTDKVWAEPARFTAQSFTQSKQAVYLYRFGYVPASLAAMLRYGAPHASEIPYVFNNLQARRGNLPVSAADTAVAKLLQQYWLNFARTGNPNGADLPLWPIFDVGQSPLLHITVNGTAEAIPEPNKIRLDVIEQAVTQAEF